MKKNLKNIDFSTVLPFVEQTNYLPGQVVSKTLAQNEAVSLTLFAFDKGEEISTHASEGDALVLILDGAGEVTINNETFQLKTGDSIVMPAGQPHSVYAPERFKMFLIVVFPKREENLE